MSAVMKITGMDLRDARHNQSNRDGIFTLKNKQTNLVLFIIRQQAKWYF